MGWRTIPPTEPRIKGPGRVSRSRRSARSINAVKREASEHSVDGLVQRRRPQMLGGHVRSTRMTGSSTYAPRAKPGTMNRVGSLGTALGMSSASTAYSTRTPRGSSEALFIG